MAWVPVGKVWAKVSGLADCFTWAASCSPLVTPALCNCLERVMPWPFWFSPMSTAMSRCGPARPSWAPYIIPYSTWAASSSPVFSLSRTPAQDASLLGVMFSPYLLPNPWVAATTTEAQSVSGMKPMRRSVFSGASEPAAQAALRRKPGAARLRPATAMDCLRKVRRVESRSFMQNFLFGHKKTAPRRVPCEGKGNPTDAVVRSRGRRHWRAARVHLLLSKGLASFSEALKSLWKQGVGVCKGGEGGRAMRCTGASGRRSCARAAQSAPSMRKRWEGRSPRRLSQPVAAEAPPAKAHGSQRIGGWKGADPGNGSGLGLARLGRRGDQAVGAEHGLDAADGLADAILVLDQGKAHVIVAVVAEA